MNRIITLISLLLSTSIVTLNQAAPLLYHRDTLNILRSFGREVSVTEQGRFVVDSIIPGDIFYPCSVKHTGFFFASLLKLPVCPCCPLWSIGAPRAFYIAQNNNNINWSLPLVLNNTAIFSKLDVNKTEDKCYLPITSSDHFLIFTDSIIKNKVNYLLVHVIKDYLDASKPYQEGGGAMDYPRTICNNMLIVEMWFQPDGTPNFNGVQFTSTLPPPRITGSNPIIPSHKEKDTWYNLQGNVIADIKSPNMPRGCYLLKYGSILKKQVVFPD